MSRPESKPVLFRTVLTWALVLIPLGWEVYQSVVKSMPLFRMTDARK